MAITDEGAIAYVTEHVRSTASRMTAMVRHTRRIRDEWDQAAGNNDAKFDLLQRRIEKAATRILRTYRACQRADDAWRFGSMSGVIPNDAAEVLHDNADRSGPDPRRNELTGQDIRRCLNRFQEFVNFLERGTDLDKQWVDPGVLPIVNDYLDHIGRMSSDGARANQTTNRGQVVANQRAEDIVQQYYVDETGKWGHLVTCSIDTTLPDVEDPEL